jgi:ABC-type proline/glycine betaine transport system ATPase subunit
VEIYKKGKVLSINQRFADFVDKPDNEFIDAFLGEKDSVLKELAETEPEGEFRLHEKVGVGEVYKFYKGKILKEIVFYPYNGMSRVYEIEFRER